MIVLDTHTFIWYVSNPEQLSKEAFKKVKNAEKNNAIYISSISVWEVCMLVQKDRLKLNTDVSTWISMTERLPSLNFQPVTNAIAIQSVALPNFRNQDPADRIIIATAQMLDAPIATKDIHMQKYVGVETIW